MLVGDLGLTVTGANGPSSLNFSGGLDLYGNYINIDGETTFQYTPCVSNGSDKVELVDKNYLEEKLENINFPEVFESLHVSHNDSLSATTLDVTGDGIQAYSGKDVWISGNTLTLDGEEVVFPNGSNEAMKITNNGGANDPDILMNGKVRIYGNQHVFGAASIRLLNKEIGDRAVRTFLVSDEINGDHILRCMARGNGETSLLSTASHILLESDDIQINGQPIVTEEYVNNAISSLDVSLPESATFKSLMVGGSNDTSASSGSESSSVNLVVDEVGVSIAKDNSIIDVNETGVDIQSGSGTQLNITNDGVSIELSENYEETGNYDNIKENVSFTVSSGSWPILTASSGNGYEGNVHFFTSDFSIFNIGYGGPLSINSVSGVKITGETNFEDEVKQGGKPLATKEYVDSKGGYPEIIDLLD